MVPCDAKKSFSSTPAEKCQHVLPRTSCALKFAGVNNGMISSVAFCLHYYERKKIARAEVRLASQIEREVQLDLPISLKFHKSLEGEENSKKKKKIHCVFPSFYNKIIISNLKQEKRKEEKCKKRKSIS